LHQQNKSCHPRESGDPDRRPLRISHAAGFPLSRRPAVFLVP
jgi:hypothetical protein